MQKNKYIGATGHQSGDAIISSAVCTLVWFFARPCAVSDGFWSVREQYWHVSAFLLCVYVSVLSPYLALSVQLGRIYVFVSWSGQSIKETTRNYQLSRNVRG